MTDSEALKIVAFGDSVTAGHTRAGVVQPEIAYHAKVAAALRSRLPDQRVEVVNAGVPGDTVTEALARLDDDVIRHGPGLVLVAFGLNDAVGMRGMTGGIAGIPLFEDSLANACARARRECGASVVLLTPNFMATSDNPNVDVMEREYLPAMTRLQTEGVVAAYAAAVRGVAADQGVAVADVYAAWEGLAAAGRDTNELLANGLNHPGEEGHALSAETVLAVLDPR
ncbi:MAG TPA: GDSL-type esterase/lipase family protein [Trueperaceae bacterium]